MLAELVSKRKKTEVQDTTASWQHAQVADDMITHFFLETPADSLNRCKESSRQPGAAHIWLLIWWGISGDMSGHSSFIVMLLLGHRVINVSVNIISPCRFLMMVCDQCVLLQHLLMISYKCMMTLPDFDDPLPVFMVLYCILALLLTCDI